MCAAGGRVTNTSFDCPMSSNLSTMRPPNLIIPTSKVSNQSFHSFTSKMTFIVYKNLFTGLFTGLFTVSSLLCPGNVVTPGCECGCCQAAVPDTRVCVGAANSLPAPSGASPCPRCHNSLSLCFLSIPNFFTNVTCPRREAGECR